MGKTYRPRLSTLSERTERSRSPPAGSRRKLTALLETDIGDETYTNPRTPPSPGSKDAKFENPRCAPVRPGPAWQPQPGDSKTPRRYEEYLDEVREEDNREREKHERRWQEYLEEKKEREEAARRKTKREVLELERQRDLERQAKKGSKGKGKARSSDDRGKGKKKSDCVIL